LGGGGDVLLHGQVGQKGLDFPAAHLLRVSFVVEQNVPLDPVHVSLFGANRVVLDPDDVADTFDKLSTGLI